eukprot:scpid72455/ scgid6429/ 
MSLLFRKMPSEKRQDRGWISAPHRRSTACLAVVFVVIFAFWLRARIRISRNNYLPLDFSPNRHAQRLLHPIPLRHVAVQHASSLVSLRSTSTDGENQASTSNPTSDKPSVALHPSPVSNQADSTSAQTLAPSTVPARKPAYNTTTRRNSSHGMEPSTALASPPSAPLTSGLQASAKQKIPIECTSKDAQCCTKWSEYYGQEPLYLESLPPSLSLQQASQAKKCRRVLLIVIFNFPFLHQVPLLTKMYGEAATKLVYYSDVENKTLGVRRVPLERGFFQQRAISDAMRRDPGYDGYLWISDDMYLGYPALFSRRNFNNIWTFPHELPARYVNNKGTDPYYHWNMPYGRAACQLGYLCLADKYVRRVQAHLGCTDCMVKGASDFGYIPRRYVPSFMELAYVFRNVFFEIAIPSILKMIVDDVKTDLDIVDDGLYIWGPSGAKAEKARKAWRVTTPFIHPVKFSNKPLAANAQSWLKVVRAKFQNAQNWVCKPS